MAELNLSWNNGIRGTKTGSRTSVTLNCRFCSQNLIYLQVWVRRSHVKQTRTVNDGFEYSNLCPLRAELNQVVISSCSLGGVRHLNDLQVGTDRKSRGGSTKSLDFPTRPAAHASCGLLVHGFHVGCTAPWGQPAHQVPTLARFG